jgi:hypothetical protein
MRKLGQDVRGNFRCDIGQPVQRFYLGTDEREAYIRRAKLDQLWAAQKERVGKWDELSLMVGKAIAAGKPVDLPGLDSLGTFAHAQRLAELRKRFPMASFVVPEVVADDAKEQADRLREEAEYFRNGFTHGVQFHQAMDRFKDHIRLTKKPGTDEPTDSAVQICHYVDLQKEHIADFPMTALTLTKIDEVLAYWTNRPATKRGNPMARDTIRDVVKIFRRFLRWAHREGVWSKPPGYEVTPLRIRLLSEEFAKKARAEQVDRYKRDELVTLYQYATPWERLLLLLALNCGFGRAELATLRRDEVRGKFIKRIRRKTGVYGEWYLWPETRKALEWWEKNRPPFDIPELLVTKDGNPFWQRTEGGNPNSKIANAFTRLLNRIKKDHRDFRRLSFNKLRKTAGNIIRHLASGEVMRIFHSRGRPVLNDEHSERYSNRTFKRVFRAQMRARKYLAPMFASVTDPFPEDQRVRHPALSVGTINKIKTMRRQGFKVAAIAKELNVSQQTVRRYAKEGSNEQRPRSVAGDVGQGEERQG